jgi:hypothetical protein
VCPGRVGSRSNKGFISASGLSAHVARGRTPPRRAGTTPQRRGRGPGARRVLPWAATPAAAAAKSVCRLNVAKTRAFAHNPTTAPPNRRGRATPPSLEEALVCAKGRGESPGRAPPRWKRAHRRVRQRRRRRGGATRATCSRRCLAAAAERWLRGARRGFVAHPRAAPTKASTMAPRPVLRLLPLTRRRASADGARRIAALDASLEEKYRLSTGHGRGFSPL